MNAMPKRIERDVIKALVNRFLMLSKENLKASEIGNLIVPISVSDIPSLASDITEPRLI